MSRAAALRELSRWDVRVRHPFAKDREPDWPRPVLTIRPKGFDIVALDTEMSGAGYADLRSLFRAVGVLTEPPKIRRARR